MAWKTKLTLAVATLTLAAWWGYSSERHVRDDAGSKPKTLRSVVRHIMAPKSRSAAIQRLNELRHAGGRTGLTTAQAAECWQIIRAFSVEDVKAYLADLPAIPGRFVNDTLVGMLFHRWAQLDGAAAVEAASQPPYKDDRNAIYSAAAAFVERDLDAAMRWAATKDDDLKRMMSGYIGRLLALQDPLQALARADAGCPFAREAVLRTLFQQMGGTPESRREFFALTAGKISPQEWNSCLRQITYTRSGKEPQENLALVEEFKAAGVPAEQLESFQKDILRYSAYDNAEKNLDWMLRPDSNVPEKQQVDAYATWAVNEPEKAVAWAARNNKADLIAGTVKKQSLQLLRSNWQPGVNEGFWAMGVRTQFHAWQQQQPADANAWLQSMPGDLRTHLAPATQP